MKDGCCSITLRNVDVLTIHNGRCYARPFETVLYTGVSNTAGTVHSYKCVCWVCCCSPLDFTQNRSKTRTLAWRSKCGSHFWIFYCEKTKSSEKVRKLFLKNLLDDKPNLRKHLCKRIVFTYRSKRRNLSKVLNSFVKLSVILKY